MKHWPECRLQSSCPLQTVASCPALNLTCSSDSARVFPRALPSEQWADVCVISPLTCTALPRNRACANESHHPPEGSSGFSEVCPLPWHLPSQKATPVVAGEHQAKAASFPDSVPNVVRLDTGRTPVSSLTPWPISLDLQI